MSLCIDTVSLAINCFNVIHGKLIVGDLFEIIPLLTEEIRRVKGEG
jgi:hypothetical protein